MRRSRYVHTSVLNHVLPLTLLCMQNLLDEANELKLEGNEHFRKQSWDEALAVYRSALGRLPRRKIRAQAQTTQRDPADKGKGKARDTGDSDEEDGQNSSSDTLVDPLEPEPSELEREIAKARAVLNSNIGACYVKLVGVSSISVVIMLHAFPRTITRRP